MHSLLEYGSTAAAGRRVAESLVAQIDGRSRVVIASVDGFALATAGALEADASKLAAIASSMAALAQAAGRETGIGSARAVVIECATGRLLLRHVATGAGAEVVVVLLAESKVLLGMLMHRLADAERLLQEST